MNNTYKPEDGKSFVISSFDCDSRIFNVCDNETEYKAEKARRAKIQATADAHHQAYCEYMKKQEAERGII